MQQMAEATAIAGMLRELCVLLSRKRALATPEVEQSPMFTICLPSRSATAAFVTQHLASHELPAVIVAAHLSDTPRYQHWGEIGSARKHSPMPRPPRREAARRRIGAAVMVAKFFQDASHRRSGLRSPILANLMTRLAERMCAAPVIYAALQ